MSDLLNDFINQCATDSVNAVRDDEHMTRAQWEAREEIDAAEAAEAAERAHRFREDEPAQADAHRAITTDLLDLIEDFLDDYADVRDGSYGESVPNRAMNLLNQLRDEMGRG